MDNQTPSILQNLLDLSKSQARDIAELQAANAIYYQIVAAVVYNDKLFEKTPVQADTSICNSISSAREMLKHAKSSETLELLCTEIERQLGQK